MPGLGAFALAGAAQGLGQGILERAAQAREDALRALEREQQLEDRAAGWAREDDVYARRRADALSDEGRQRGWSLEDARRAREWALSDYAMERGDALADEERGFAREAARIERAAGALQGAYRSGDASARIDLNAGGGNARFATQWLTQRGYPAHVAAGLVGNLAQESGPGLDTRAVGDNGNSFGAGQWNGPRRRALMTFAADRGRPADDLETQLEFLDWEMNNTESAARDAILKASTPEEAARVASERFWRPGVPHVERRQAYAADIYRTIADPETPESVRDDLRAAVGMAPDGGAAAAEPAAYSRQVWVRQDDGTTMRMGYNDATGAYEPVPGPDGQPLMQAATAREAKPPELSPSAELRIRRAIEAANSGAEPLTSYEEVDVTVDAIKAEVQRLMAEEGVAEAEAERRAMEAMERRTETVPGRDGWFRDEPETTRRGVWTGRFVYGDQRSAAAAAPPSDDELFRRYGIER